MSLYIFHQAFTGGTFLENKMSFYMSLYIYYIIFVFICQILEGLKHCWKPHLKAFLGERSEEKLALTDTVKAPQTPTCLLVCLLLYNQR